MTEATADRIIDVARDLLDREGSSGVTMRRVATPLRITPMAIYKHYRNRAALLNALADSGFAELAAALAKKRFVGQPEKRLLQMMNVYMEFSIKNPQLFALMFLEKREGARRFPDDFIAGRSPTANLVADVVTEGMHSGRFARGDVWEIVFALGALAHGLTLLFLGDRIDATPARFRVLCRNAFGRYIDGLRS